MSNLWGSSWAVHMSLNENLNSHSDVLRNSINMTMLSQSQSFHSVECAAFALLSIWNSIFDCGMVMSFCFVHLCCPCTWQAYEGYQAIGLCGLRGLLVDFCKVPMFRWSSPPNDGLSVDSKTRKIEKKCIAQINGLASLHKQWNIQCNLYCLSEVWQMCVDLSRNSTRLLNYNDLSYRHNVLFNLLLHTPSPNGVVVCESESVNRQIL